MPAPVKIVGVGQSTNEGNFWWMETVHETDSGERHLIHSPMSRPVCMHLLGMLTGVLDQSHPIYTDPQPCPDCARFGNWVYRLNCQNPKHLEK